MLKQLETELDITSSSSELDASSASAESETMLPTSSSMMN